MTIRWIPLVALALVGLAWQGATAHKLPNFPQVRLLGAEGRRGDPFTRRLTVEVQDVAAAPASEREPLEDKPELPFDFLTVRHLAMDWGHLAGFAFWLAATGVGLLEPARRRRFVLGATWVAFVVEGATGLYKMEYGTPFATPLRLFRLDRLPRVFFADDYAATLVVKHVLMVIAMAITLALTVHGWRTKPGEGVRLWRALLGINLLLALAIAGAASVLGFYHAIVLHFS